MLAVRVVPGVTLDGGVLVAVAVLRTPVVFFAAVFAVAAPARAVFGVVSGVRLPTLETGKVADGLDASSWWTTSKLSASDIACPSRDVEA